MSALHRLKAYFGMVPAEELDAAGLDPAGFDAAPLDGYRPPYRSGYPGQDDGTQTGIQNHRASGGDWAAGDDYGEGVATRAGHHAPPRMHPARSPAWATQLRVADPRADSSWATEAPIRGSLAIDTAATNTAATNTRPTSHHPAMPPRFATTPRTDPLRDNSAHLDDSAQPAARIVTLCPYSYNEARPIGERYREGNPVIMNLTAMEDRDAKRLVDFAAGLAFALRGSIDKITNKVFLLSPPNVDVSAEEKRRIAEGCIFN